jgi:hypothetical protein
MEGFARVILNDRNARVVQYKLIQNVNNGTAYKFTY